MVDFGRGKTPGWAGATPLLGAFGCPKESWGRSSPANREVLCLRSALPASKEEKEEKGGNTCRSSTSLPITRSASTNWKSLSLADYRASDKHDSAYYARHAVEKALKELRSGSADLQSCR